MAFALLGDRSLVSAVTAACAISFAGPAAAIDALPGDYTILPAGTTLGLGYLQYGSSDELKIDGIGKVPGSSLDTTIGIARVLHYSQIGNLPVGYQAFLPMARLSNARIGGQKPGISDGIGDLTVGFTAFLMQPTDAARGTTLGVTGYLALPTGKYDESRLSVGTGTYTLTPQIGLIHGFGNGWFVDAMADVSFQKDHREGGIKYSTDPVTHLQGYLRFQPSAASSYAVGYSGLFGGKQDVGGTYTGQKSRSDTLRLVATQMLAPTWQVAGVLSTDVRAEGGFRDKYGVLIRVMKIF